MKKKQELIFENLLKEKNKLSEKNQKNKIISSEDTQLIDMLENFNESDIYKEIQPDD